MLMVLPTLEGKIRKPSTSKERKDVANRDFFRRNKKQSTSLV